MRHRIATLVASSVVLMGFTLPAFANAVIEFTGVANDGVYDGFYAGVYQGTVNGNSATFVCDDFLSEIYKNDQWTANVSSNNPVTTGSNGVRYLGTGSTKYYISNPNLSVGVLGYSLSQQQEYNMISWLVEQIFSDPTNHYRNWGSEAGAIWSIADGGWGTMYGNSCGTFNCSYLGTNGDTSGITAQGYVTLALGHRNDTNLPGYNIYTPTPGLSPCTEQNQPGYCNGQEFFGPKAAEPSTVVLLTMVLLAGVALSSSTSGRWRRPIANR